MSHPVNSQSIRVYLSPPELMFLCDILRFTDGAPIIQSDDQEDLLCELRMKFLDALISPEKEVKE